MSPWELGVDSSLHVLYQGSWEGEEGACDSSGDTCAAGQQRARPSTGQGLPEFCGRGILDIPPGVSPGHWPSRSGRPDSRQEHVQLTGLNNLNTNAYLPVPGDLG